MRLKNVSLVLLSTVCSAALLPAAAFAQEATELAPITVQAQTKEDPKAPVKGFVAKTSSTATKTGTPILETQQSISVITADQLKAQNAQTVGQALDYTPGVVSQPGGSDPRFDAPRIRGFDGRQSQYLNGLRLMRTAGAPAIDPYQLERIEVLRGPASVMFGQGNPGGIINLISKRPTFDSFGEVGLQFGSYDTYGTYFDVGGPVTDGSDFAYRVTGLARTASAQVDELDNDRYFIAPAFTWQPDEDTKLTILTSVQHDNPSTPSGVPALFADTLGRDFYVGDKSFDHSNRTLTNLGYEFEHRLNDTWTFRQNLRYSNFDWNYQALGMSSTVANPAYGPGVGADGHSILRNATFQDELLNTFNVDNNLLGEFETGDLEHKLLVGLDYRYFSNNVHTRFFRATPLDILNPVYGGPISLLSRTTDTIVDTNLSQVGIYIQDEMAYDNWRATFGLRQDWASTEGDTTNFLPATPVSRSLDQNDHKLTGRAGLGYVFDNGIAPYVNYSTSFEPVAPSTSLANPVPTEGKQLEIGVKYQPDGWDGFFSAAVYDLRQKNVSNTQSIGGTSVTNQIGEVRVRGVELEGVTSLTDGLNLRAAYTYTDAKADAPGTLLNGLPLDNVPEHAASLWVDYSFAEGSPLEGVGIGAGVRYVGERYGYATYGSPAALHIYDLDAVTLFDAALTYKKEGITASLNFRNLADKDYIASCSSFGCTYGDGRTVMGKLTFNW